MDHVARVITKLVNRYKLQATLVPIVFILTGMGWLAYSRWAGPHTEQAKSGCNSDILAEASNLLATTRTSDLKPVAENIQKIEGYEKDPNCLNVVITYYINTSDYASAQAALDKLEGIYDKSKGFSPELGAYAKDMNTIRSNV